MRGSNRSWPLTLALPLGVAVGMFVVAVGTTQVAMAVLAQREARMLQEKAVLLLDAVADIAAPALPIDPRAIDAALSRAASLRGAFSEEALVLRWSGLEGEERVVARGRHDDPALAAAVASVAAAPEGTLAFVHEDRLSRALVARPYEIDGTRLVVGAILDASDIAAERRSDRAWALAIDVGLALIAAFLTFALARRAVAPLDSLARDLVGQTSGEARARARPRSAEVQRLQDAIERRLRVEEERALAVADQSERERNALLARLAAGLAHEVRNPLAGLLNAVSTLRRFGADASVRAETLDLIERGLRSIERVADTTLSSYRPAPGRMSFTADDLRDLQILVTPEARHRQIGLDWRVDGMAPIAADADAMRQILLNLLINACKATPDGGRVGLSVAQDEAGTEFVVSDSGPGMPDGILDFVAEGGAKAPPIGRGKGLGLWLVSRLLEDVGGRIRVETRSGEGARVFVRIPAASAPAEPERRTA